MLNWPKQLPDLNPIEYLCGGVERETQFLDRIITGHHDNSMDPNLERVLSEHQVHTK